MEKRAHNVLIKSTGMEFESIKGRVRVTKEEKKARERVDSLDSHSSNSDDDDYETLVRRMKAKGEMRGQVKKPEVKK